MIRETISKLLRNYFPHLFNSIITYRRSKCRDETIYTNPGGFRFKGHKGMGEGKFEQTETKLFKSLVKKVDLVINVGANIGYYVCLAKANGCGVMAFEPNPENLTLLYENLLLNKWTEVEVFPIALGGGIDLLPMYGSGTGASFVEGWAGISVYQRQYLPINTMNGLLQTRISGTRRILFWIDVEGFEFEVLKGASEIISLRENDIWVVEVCIDEHFPDGVCINPNLRKIFDYFWDRGYQGYELNFPLKKVNPADIQVIIQERENIFSTHNFVFIKNNFDPLSLGSEF